MTETPPFWAVGSVTLNDESFVCLVVNNEKIAFPLATARVMASNLIAVANNIEAGNKSTP